MTARTFTALARWSLVAAVAGDAVVLLVLLAARATT